MGRWTQHDEDEQRLPDGFRRVAYDADAARYHFRDADGQLWAGPPGARFGEMKRVSESDTALTMDTDASDIEHGGPPTPAYAPTSPYRTLFPFFLIIMTVLLLAWRLLLSPAYVPPPCPPHSAPRAVRAGDTCWRLRGTTLDDFRAANPAVDCAALRVGSRVCVPTPAPPPAERRRRARA